MNSLTLESPAKINLCLYVLGKRPDGYHELLTLFQRISLRDRVLFRKTRSGFRLQCRHPLVPCDSRNLIEKAWRLVQSRTGLRGGMEVILDKRIPVAGGLGGGSSNAATTLLAANRLFGLRLSQPDLMEMGRKLGADVPFFLLETSRAIGRGRGDELQPLAGATKLSVLLTLFSSGISTKSVFESLSRPALGPTLTKLNCDIIMISVFLASKDLKGCSTLLRNDLFKAAHRMKPEIGRVLSFLRNSRPASAMSGSGPTVFSLAANRVETEAAASEISRKFGLATWVGSLY